MTPGVTVCFYLVIGAAVAVATWISDSPLLRTGRLFGAATALFFWPMYLPVLLVSHGSSRDDQLLATNRPQPRPPSDEMDEAIAQVEQELDVALHSLNGWAEDVLNPDSDQFAELRAAWRQQAARVREIDRLLGVNEIVPAAADGPGSLSSRIIDSERSRQENLAKLKQVRQQCHDDLMATIAWVRQLVTMIHLAHYTGAPASRAAELVRQIAQAVERLTTAKEVEMELNHETM